jgi:hypothetical protein
VKDRKNRAKFYDEKKKWNASEHDCRKSNSLQAGVERGIKGAVVLDGFLNEPRLRGGFRLARLRLAAFERIVL